MASVAEEPQYAQIEAELRRLGVPHDMPNDVPPEVLQLCAAMRGTSHAQWKDFFMFHHLDHLRVDPSDLQTAVTAGTTLQVLQDGRAQVGQPGDGGYVPPVVALGLARLAAWQGGGSGFSLADVRFAGMLADLCVWAKTQAARAPNADLAESLARSIRAGSADGEKERDPHTESTHVYEDAEPGRLRAASAAFFRLLGPTETQHDMFSTSQRGPESRACERGLGASPEQEPG